MSKSERISSWTSEFLWVVILIPVLAISWVGFYTIARAVGVPPVFAAGMSAAFDGVALFAARIGLKHRRKGFSGYLARVTVIIFAGLGAFVQSFHGETTTWVHAHAWIVWATAPVAACLCYELHLGWVHRKQLIRQGYHHPSAKSGFGPATWLVLGGTWGEYRKVLRARRDFIAAGNLSRFVLEEAAQPTLPEPKPTPRPQPKPRPRPEPQGPPGPRLHSVPASTVKKSRTSSRTSSRTPRDQAVRDWCRTNGYALGYKDRILVEGLRAYRAAHPQEQRAS
jgi:hypothetical protein